MSPSAKKKAIGNSPDYNTWIQPPLKHCWFLTGPTCSGKTPVAIEVAERLQAEIISLDSMAIYRGMDIGTAKPSAEQRARIPHHLIDIVDPTDAYSVSNYVVAAHEISQQIRSSGGRVLLCGGTPLYLKSLLRGLFLGPQADWDFRKSVEADLRQHDEQALLERLRQVDPLLAHKLHPHDHRRIIRALEVAKITGRPLSHWQKQFDTPASTVETPVVVLQLERAWLHERINRRVDEMMRAGLVDEVSGLMQSFGQLGRTAAQAVGYREVIDHLQRDVPLEETTELIKAHTRQFARRQEIWFRGLTELRGIRLEENRPMESAVEEIVTVFREASSQ
jgi:tRNA dimethylallyltransferase